MEQLPFTALLNKFFGGIALSLLNALGIHPQHPEAPISNFVAMEILVALILVGFFLLVRSRLSVESPGGLQHVMEGIHGFVQGQSQEIIGHHSEAYTPFLVTLGLFILGCNLLGLLPAFESPTANPSVPLGCAICAFAYYNFSGMRKQGVLHYLKHFAGPMPLLAPLMIPIELISHSARMLSLTIRLFANIFAGDMVTLVFFSLVPVGVPIIFLGLHIGVSFLQAYIFVLLTTVYLAGAVAEEH
ncbi:MAG: F0F1 ATP synthase subunit A [Acidobacteriia bacterium]|nr:F0F1 ATP synthase subunit A [Terriglobia bacterium]